MRRALCFAFCLLTFFFLLSCTTPAPVSPPTQSAFFVFRVNPPALVKLSPDFQPAREIPISIPAGCALDNLYPSPRGVYLAMELGCSFGQTVVWINSDTGEVKQAVTDSDSHFLSWTPDGQAIYLKADAIGNPHIVRVNVDGQQEGIPIMPLTYDLAPSPDGGGFTFAFSRGMGLGSEMWMAGKNGNSIRQIVADKNNYLSFARWSPDGRQIAFIKIPDSQIPFTVGELWIMNADGSGARKLADADAGHGFPPAWSPDGSRIAFVMRANPLDPVADQNADALRSNIYVVDTGTGKLMQWTHLDNARVEAPLWSPDGNQIAFTAVLNDKMNVYLADDASGAAQMILTEPACCPAWIQK